MRMTTMILIGMMTMPKERELSVAQYREGLVATPREWIEIPRENPDYASSVGITMDSLNDFVAIRLRNGRTVTIFGDGELWFHGANHLHLNSDELPWR